MGIPTIPQACVVIVERAAWIDVVEELLIQPDKGAVDGR
jgi:hypothetical protein